MELHNNVGKLGAKECLTTSVLTVDVNEGVIQPTPGDHGRNLFYYPGTFDLKTMAKDYEVCDFEGDVLISDAEHDVMDEFLSWFQ